MTQIEMLAKALGVTTEQLQALASNAKDKAKEERKASRKFSASLATSKNGNVGVLVKFSRGYPVWLFKTQIVELMANLDTIKKLGADPSLTSAS